MITPRIRHANETCKLSVEGVNENTRKKTVQLKYLNQISNGIDELIVKNSKCTRREDLVFGAIFTIPKKYQSSIIMTLKDCGYDVETTKTTLTIKLNLYDYLI